ncbi:MAG: hypothetical protein FH749_14530 [Firmicutes bacterium]|nr:hypothetical protein [Bacillota bacterium]
MVRQIRGRLIFAPLLLCLLFVLFCQANEVTVIVENPTLSTEDTLHLVFVNNTGRKVYYGDRFVLEKYEDGVWVDLQYQKSVLDWASSLEPREKVEFSHELSLAPGEYRYLKEFFWELGEDAAHKIVAEFTVQ